MNSVVNHSALIKGLAVTHKFGSASLVLVLFACLYCPQTQATCNAQIPKNTHSDSFINNGDGTVTHLTTGLMWKRCQEGLSGTTCSIGSRSHVNWKTALDIAGSNVYAGHSDWRLPNIKELASIVEYGCTDPAINQEIFPNMDDFWADYFWSSSPTGTTEALRVRFQTGGWVHESGMSSEHGVRLVRDTEGAPFNINPALNDAWFNPATSGQGFFLNVFPNIGQVFLAWFTYDTSRPPGTVMANVGDPGHRWITAFGPYNGDTATLEIEITEGGIFDSGQPAPIQLADGSIILEFSGCNSGTVTYHIPSIGRQGVVPIERLALDNVPACEALAAQATRGSTLSVAIEGSVLNEPTGTNFQINRGLNDGWFNPLTSGQGFFMNVFPNLGQMFLAWFTFDTQRPAPSVVANLGDPGHRWLTAFGPYAGNQANLQIEITRGGIFNASQPTPTQSADGTMTVEMTDCENGTITYDITSTDSQGQIPIKRLALDNVPLCQALDGQ